MRRASVSIPSNIAEGASRYSDIEFLWVLYIARSSASEIETQLLISENLNYIKGTQNKLNRDQLEILKMLTSLINKIKQRV